MHAFPGIKSKDAIGAGYAMQKGTLSFPPSPYAFEKLLVPLSVLGNRGAGSGQIASSHVNQKGMFKGPFQLTDLQAPLPETPYPVLWAHTSKKQKCLIVDPDSTGIPLPGHENVHKTYGTSMQGRCALIYSFALTRSPYVHVSRRSKP